MLKRILPLISEVGEPFSGQLAPSECQYFQLTLDLRAAEGVVLLSR